METKEEIYEKIIKNDNNIDVFGKVDEAIPDFLNSDWEDEFEDIYEAYEEQGRGEAESQVLREVMAIYGASDLDIDEYVDLLEEVAEYYGLSLN